MTVAVILATGRTRGTSGMDPPVHLARLRARLATLNVPDVHVIGRPGAGAVPAAGGGTAIESPDMAGDLRRLARLARRANVPVVILPADLLVSTGLLDRFVNGTGEPLAALTVTPGEAGRYGTASARVHRGRVIRVGGGTKTNAAFPGALRFEASEGAAIADLLESLADRAGSGMQGDAAGLLLAGLVRAGRTVAACPAKGEVCRRLSEDETGGGAVRTARAEMEAAETRYEDQRRLVSAGRGDDGFFTTFAVRSYSPHLVRWIAGREITAGTVTAASAALALLAALWFSAGTRPGMVTGAVLVYLAYVLDVVAGQLACYTGRRTGLAAWLDGMCVRGKEYAVYLGLAIGSTAAAAGGTADGDVWALAVAVLALQAVRQLTDASYQARVLTGPEPPQRVLRREGTLRARLASRLSRARALYWAKRILALPAGERVALIAVTAAFFDARVTFLALLTWGTIAVTYILTGRIRRVSAA